MPTHSMSELHSCSLKDCSFVAIWGSSWSRKMLMQAYRAQLAASQAKTGICKHLATYWYLAASLQPLHDIDWERRSQQYDKMEENVWHDKMWL